MEKHSFTNVSINKKKVFESDLLMTIIFGRLGWQDRLNLSLCCKDIYSIFAKRNKVLKTSIKIPHTSNLKDIDIHLLKEIFSKYKNIEKVETLFGYEPERLKVISDANLVNLEILRISCITSNFGQYINMFNLKELYLEWSYNQEEITNLSFLCNLVNLEKLKLDSGAITDIESIKGLTKLKEFSLFRMSRRKEDLQRIHYHYYKEFIDITPISFCTNLEKLKLISSDIKSIEPIKKLFNLKELVLSNIGSITDLLPISNLTNLKILILGSLNIKDIEPIMYLVNLEILKIYQIYLSDFSPISYLNNIKVLKLSRTRIKDIEQIKELKN